MNNPLNLLKKYNLFIDLDDVLISSHNEMNGDLIKKHPEHDWENVSRCEGYIQLGLNILLNMNDERSMKAYHSILSLRDKIKFENVRYDYMKSMFDYLHQPSLDSHFDKEINRVYHNTINELALYFISKERYLDERDTALFDDNKITDGTHAVRYEKYYTKDRLMSDNNYSRNPEYVRELEKHPAFKKPLMVLSHMNGQNETKAKDKFLKECYPNTFFVPLFFHKENCLDKEVRRTRFSKAEYVRDVLKQDLSISILIDDSIDNIINWSRNGGIAILYDLSGTKTDTDEYFVIHSLALEEINRVLDKLNQKVLVKS